MDANKKLFEIKYDILGTRISFMVVSATIDDALIAGHELCSLSVGNEYKENALNGVYMHSFNVTKIDYIVLEKEKQGKQMIKVMQDIEKWECNECGDPCRVEVFFENTDIEHVDVNPRFSGVCICKESFPNWKRIDDKPLDTSVECDSNWQQYADGCPWKYFRGGVPSCNGNIDEYGVSAPCCEEECAIYHFVESLSEGKIRE